MPGISKPSAGADRAGNRPPLPTFGDNSQKSEALPKISEAVLRYDGGMMDGNQTGNYHIKSVNDKTSFYRGFIAKWPLSDLNRYSFWEMDFESIASANSAKRPLLNCLGIIAAFLDSSRVEQKIVNDDPARIRR